MDTAVAVQELTAQDRCDRCSARAKIMVRFISGQLYFCGHHANELGYTLALKSIGIYDPEGVLEYADQ